MQNESTKIKIAAVQMDYVPAAFIEIYDLLTEPIKPFVALPGHGMAFLTLNSKTANDKCIEFISKHKKDYIELLNIKIGKILMFSAQHNVDIVVFPEYSIPAESLLNIRKLVEEYKINIVAGSHSVLNGNYEIYREIEMKKADEKKLKLRSAISPIFHIDGKVEYIAKSSRTQRMDYDFSQGGHWKIINFKIKHDDSTDCKYKKIKASIYLCIDYVEDMNNKSSKSTIKDKSINDFSDTDIIIVSSYTPAIEPFERLAINCLEGYKKAVIFVNAVDKGGTRIFCHFDSKIKQQLFTILDDGKGSFKLPGGEEGITIVTLDPKKQYTVNPTSYPNYECSKQEGVYPFIYSYTLNKFENIKTEFENAKDDYNEKKCIIKKHENVIREWSKHSIIYRDKIAKMYHNLDNLLPYQLDFFFDVFCLDNEIKLMDKWRLEKVDEINKLFDLLLKEENLLVPEREILYKLKIYYSMKQLELESNKLIKFRDTRIKQSRYTGKRILWVTTKEGVSKTLFEDYQNSNIFYDLTEIMADCIEDLFNDKNGKLIPCDVLIISITSSHNPFHEIKDRIGKHYKKLILVICEDVDCDLSEKLNYLYRKDSEYITKLNSIITMILEKNGK